MENVLGIFKNELGDVRIIPSESGRPSETLFCAKDVAKCLGYVKERNAIQRHCRDGAVKRGVVTSTTNQYGTTSEQTNEMTFITLGDVARLISHSKLPSAIKFERWLYDEVLPSIYDNGSYRYQFSPDTYQYNFGSGTSPIPREPNNMEVINEVNKMFKIAIPAITEELKQYIDIKLNITDDTKTNSVPLIRIVK